jgi:hypothetical protein
MEKIVYNGYEITEDKYGFIRFVACNTNDCDESMLFGASIEEIMEAIDLRIEEGI